MVPRSRHCGSLGELVSTQNARKSLRIRGDPCGNLQFPSSVSLHGTLENASAELCTLERPNVNFNFCIYVLHEYYSFL